MSPSYSSSTGQFIKPARAGKRRLHILADEARLDFCGRVIQNEPENSPPPSSHIKHEHEERSTAFLEPERDRDPQRRPSIAHRGSGSCQRAFQLQNPTQDARGRQRPTTSRSPDRFSEIDLISSSSDCSSGSDFDSDDNFRPSKSPSRLPGTPSPTTRSQSHGRHIAQQRAISVPNTDSQIHVAIQSVRQDVSGSCASQNPNNDTALNSSPLGSISHGWRIINKKKKAKTTTGSGYRTSNLETGWNAGSTVMDTANGSGQIQEKTPSYENCDHHSVRFANAGKVEKLEQDQTCDNTSKKHNKNDKDRGDEREKDKEEKKRKRKLRKGQERHICIHDGQRDEVNGKAPDPDSREGGARRPPRLARIEPSIEQTPTPDLPTPEPSSAHNNASRHTHSPGLPLYSPLQQPTPASSDPTATYNPHSTIGPSSSRCGSAPVRAGAKRRRVEFIDLGSSEADTRSRDDLKEFFESRLRKYEHRLDEHEQKQRRLEEHLIAQITRFTKEVDKQIERLDGVEASRDSMIESLESLKQQFREADSIARQHLADARVASSGELSQQHTATARLTQTEVRPFESHNLDFCRRIPAGISRTLVRSGSNAARRQRLAAQIRIRQPAAEPGPSYYSPSAVSTASRQATRSNVEGSRATVSGVRGSIR